MCWGEWTGGWSLAPAGQGRDAAFFHLEGGVLFSACTPGPPTRHAHCDRVDTPTSTQPAGRASWGRPPQAARRDKKPCRLAFPTALRLTRALVVARPHVATQHAQAVGH